jgi:hypothetical protein
MILLLQTDSGIWQSFGLEVRDWFFQHRSSHEQGQSDGPGGLSSRRVDSYFNSK